ncbi:MAG: DNA-binding protein [Candidatus Pacebacteria bacterium]|nr:DNA-binding protein [Candidatus Paceibacterota bacterium]
MAISKEKDNLIIARLFPKENVMEQLKEICKKHKIQTGIFLFGIGQLAEFELGFFKEKGNYMNQKFETPHELLSLSGNISFQENGYDFHLHAALSAADKSVVGGHFIAGVVSITLEVAILKTEIKIHRVIEEETGLQGLSLTK